MIYEIFTIILVVCLSQPYTFCRILETVIEATKTAVVHKYEFYATYASRESRTSRKNIVSQIHPAFAAVATALHCERSCARENVSFRDMPVSEEMWSSQVVLGRPLERLQEGSGDIHLRKRREKMKKKTFRKENRSYLRNHWISLHNIFNILCSTLLLNVYITYKVL